MKVAVAQMAPIVGDIRANLDRIREFQQEAVAAGTELVVYPELAVSGYLTGAATGRYALSRESASFQELLDASLELPMIVGTVERSMRGRVYNSAVLLDGGEVKHVHRKIYLPTYGPWEEKKHFASGKRLEVFEYRGFRVAIFICYDFWYPSMVYLAACDDADVLVVIANSSLDQEGMGPRTWDLLIRQPAALYGNYVVFCNRVGIEGEWAFWGGSAVVAPQGRSEVTAGTSEELVTATLDKQRIAEAREGLPLLRDLDLDFTKRELERIMERRLVEND